MMSAPVKKWPMAKHCGGCEIDHEAEESEEIRIDAGSGERADNFVEQPFASFADAACDSHRERGE